MRWTAVRVVVCDRETRIMEDRMQRALTLVVLALVSAGSERAVAQGKLTQGTPQIAREGTGYMTAPGGSYGSNTDPFASKATPDNEWGYDCPHVMLLVPDPRARGRWGRELQHEGDQGVAPARCVRRS